MVADKADLFALDVKSENPVQIINGWLTAMSFADVIGGFTVFYCVFCSRSG